MKAHPKVVETLDRKLLLTRLRKSLEESIEAAKRADLTAQLVSLIRYKEFVAEEIGTAHEEYLALVKEHHSKLEFSAEAASCGSTTWYLNKVEFDVIQNKPVSLIIAQGSEDNMVELCEAMAHFYETGETE